MRCVQVQEMPPNPTHWTFSGLFLFFLDMFLLHTADSCCLEALCFQEVSFLFSFSSVLESRTVWVLVVTDQKCLGCVAFAATPGSIPDAELSCHILLSHPVLCQRLSLLHNKYFFKNAPRKGQRSRSLRPHACLILVSEISQECLEEISVHDTTSTQTQGWPGLI